jgi:hypothetical protein
MRRCGHGSPELFVLDNVRCVDTGTALRSEPGDAGMGCCDGNKSRFRGMRPLTSSIVDVRRRRRGSNGRRGTYFRCKGGGCCRRDPCADTTDALVNLLHSHRSAKAPTGAPNARNRARSVGRRVMGRSIADHIGTQLLVRAVQKASSGASHWRAGMLGSSPRIHTQLIRRAGKLRPLDRVQSRHSTHSGASRSDESAE